MKNEKEIIRNYTYEVTDNGYYILLNGKRWMRQYGNNIPDPTKSYEENAIAHIEEIKADEERAKQAMIDAENEKKAEEARKIKIEQEITDNQLAIAEIYEMLEVKNNG